MYPRCKVCGGVSIRKNKFRPNTKCTKCGHRQRVPGILYTLDTGRKMRGLSLF